MHVQVAAYGKVDGCGEQAMKSEILQRGPITCSIASDDSFVYTYRHGVYKGPNATDVDHDIEVPPPPGLHAYHRTTHIVAVLLRYTRTGSCKVHAPQNETCTQER